MFAHGCGADSEDHADLGIRFSPGKPAENPALTQSQDVLATMIASAR
jgi:hypothetical protein